MHIMFNIKQKRFKWRLWEGLTKRNKLRWPELHVHVYAVVKIAARLASVPHEGLLISHCLTNTCTCTAQ